MSEVSNDLPVLTGEELRAARVACAASKAADALAAAAKKTKDGALAQVFFKMGLAAEAKTLGPEELAKEIARRAGNTFVIEGAAADFALQKTSQGRYPAWKQELLARVGPAEVASIENATPTQFSYAVIEAPAAMGAGVVLLEQEREEMVR